MMGEELVKLTIDGREAVTCMLRASDTLNEVVAAARALRELGLMMSGEDDFTMRRLGAALDPIDQESKDGEER